MTTASNIPANAPADLVELIHTAMQDAITKDCVTTLLDIAGAVAAALPAPDEKDAEIARLRAQVERLTGERDYDRRQSAHKDTVIDRLNAQITATPT